MNQETEMMQRPARMVCLHNSELIMDSLREQEVLAYFKLFHKRSGEGST